MAKLILLSAALTCAVQTAAGQCVAPANADLVSAFVAGRPNALGQLQDLSRSAWSFRSTSTAGPLFVGIELVSGYPSWGSPTRPYQVPCAGPVYSNVPALDEVNFYDRLPSFTGVLLHPGTDVGEDSLAIFSPQNTITITSLEIDAEVLGDISDGVNWKLDAIIGGSPTAMVGPIAAFYTSNQVHSTFAPTGTLPITLNPGDSLVLRTQARNAPFEDWANTNLRMTFSGGPVLLASPRNASLCADKSASLSVLAAGSGTLSYQWQYKEDAGAWTNFGNGPLTLPVAGLIADITNADKATVHFDLLGDPDLSTVQFRCVASNACHSVTSGAAQIRACIADRNCDDIVDLSDFFDWFNCWDLTLPCADIDGNSEIDLSDFFGFFAHWDLSC